MIAGKYKLTYYAIIKLHKVLGKKSVSVIQYVVLTKSIKTAYKFIPWSKFLRARMLISVGLFL